MQYTVTDTGADIPRLKLKRIRERFYRVHCARAHRNGSGLGLEIVKEIVEAHGGTVGVASTVGAGSRFWLTLPAPAGKSEAA